MPNIEGLQQYISTSSEYDVIWFNSNGDFCYSQTTEFSNPYPREEVLQKGFESKLQKALAGVVVEEPIMEEAAQEKTNTNSKK